jgi:nucleolar protein 12
MLTAFVQDRECVDEVLALEQDKVKFAKRKLRLQRCKTLPANINSKSLKTQPAPASRAPSNDRNRRKATSISIPVVPKGDPTLGKKLEHLSKDERKQRKAEDSDRVARRLAKKKVKAAIVKAEAKSQVRERARRRSDPKKVAAAQKPKRRIRSEANLRNRNAKK